MRQRFRTSVTIYCTKTKLVLGKLPPPKNTNGIRIEGVLVPPWEQGIKELLFGTLELRPVPYKQLSAPFDRLFPVYAKKLHMGSSETETQALQETNTGNIGALPDRAPLKR